MGYYRKIPVVIEAIQITEEMLESGSGLPEGVQVKKFGNGNKAIIKTLEGTMTAGVTDWIIRGVNYELYPCKDEIFQKTYESAE